MSYYLAALLRDQAILAFDRRVAHWSKGSDGPVTRMIDSPDPKYFRINESAVFFPPCNGFFGEPLARLLKESFGNSPVDIERLIKNRTGIQGEGKKIIEESREAAKESLDAQGLTEKDLGVPLLANVDCVVGGVDVAGKPFLVDFRQGFEFEVHRGAGAALACDMGVEINRWIEGRMHSFLKWAGKRILYHRLLRDLPGRKDFQRRLALKIFRKVFKFVSERDPKVSPQFDMIFIDRDGCRTYHVAEP
jgi:hypothetical protein